MTRFLYDHILIEASPRQPNLPAQPVSRASGLAARAAAALILTGAALALAGCISPARQAEGLARSGGLQTLVLSGDGFQHRAFAGVRPQRGLLFVFVDGDGTPWTDAGTQVAADPTPRSPLALKLALETPDSVLYLGRPCYFGLRPQPPCSAAYWTSRRYSAEVVTSMAAAATAFAEARGYTRVVLVGYSGGGALVTLMASHMHSVAGVVTIAANLDPDAWAQLHGYLPLTGSLNPSLQPPLARTVQEWHLLGERDARVPYEAAQRYLQRVPPDRVRRYAGFDHVCCWEAAWPPLLREVRAVLDVSE